VSAPGRLNNTNLMIEQIVKRASDYDDLLEGIKTRALRTQMTRALQHYETAKDPSHGLQHIREVVQGARDIMPESGVDLEQVLTAAILHDIARESEDATGVGHEITGPTMAKDYLSPFDPATQKNILHAIRQHRTYGHPRTLLAKVVRDADKLYAKKPEILLRRLVEYRHAHGMPEEQIPEDARQRLVGHVDKEEGRLPSLLTPKAIEMAAPWRVQMAEIKNDPVKWEAAIKPYMEVKEAASRLYRDRVEAFALTPDGKVIAGLYPDRAKNVAVPGGGIERGETAQRAAKREFKEEAGIAIKNVRSLGVAPVLTAWAKKDKSYRGKDWQASIKKHPKGNRTHFVLADIDTSKTKKTPEDPAEFLNTLKARSIDDLIRVQQKALRVVSKSDRLKQMRKRLEVLLNIKQTQKHAFVIPEGLVTGAVNSLDDIVLAAWNIHKRQQRQAMGLPPEPESPIYTQHLAQKEASLVSEIANRAKGLLTRTSGEVMQHAPLIEETMGNLATGGVGDAAVSLVPTALRKIPKFLDNVFYGKPVNFEQLYKQKDLPLGVAYGRKDYNQTVQALPAKKR